MKTEMKELNINELEQVNGGFKIPFWDDIEKKLRKLIEGEKDPKYRIDMF